MASAVICVRKFLLTGHFKQSLTRLIKCAHTTDFKSAVCLSSFTLTDMKPVFEIKKPALCLTLNTSTRKVQARSSSGYASKARDTTSIQSSSEIKCISQDQSYTNTFNPALVEELLKGMEGDMPVSGMLDPFTKDYRRCFLCNHNIIPDHKNVRLLSQFVSPYTGRIYGRAITGLCVPMQKHISRLIIRARKCGFMPFILKDPKYLKDPLPYDAMSKQN